MGLKKAIEHHKEKRKPYYGAKAVDPTCRNHGGCEWCKGNRLYRSKRIDRETRDMIKESYGKLQN